MPSLIECAEIIQDGGVVAFPTETVYGLGASIFRMDALDAIFSLKGRPTDNPLIVHISHLDMLQQLTPWFDNADVLKLAQAFWPGPLAIVVPRLPLVPDGVTGGLDTVAIRMPNHELALQLIHLTGPLAAPSANTSGKPSPTKPEHVRNDFGDRVSILDGGACSVGVESTVLDLTASPIIILRPGSIQASEIEHILGRHVSVASQSSSIRSPGTRYRHYAPFTECIISYDDNYVPNTNELVIYPDEGIISSEATVYIYKGDYDHLARELYDRFRQADLEKKKRIVILRLKNKSHHLFTALENRIGKATE